MTKNTLGILGGIGPESTGHFYLTLVRKFAEEFKPKNNTEYPHIFVNSIPAPDLIFNTASDEVLEHYKNGLKVFERNGFDLIAVVCNGAYAFYKMFQTQVAIPIIDLPKESRIYLKDRHITSITVLGTPTTIASGIYKFNDVKDSSLTNDEANILAHAIFNYNLGIEKDTQSRVVNDLAEKYLKEPDNQLLTACSEVALMLENTIPQVRLIDPMDILSDAVINWYKR